MAPQAAAEISPLLFPTSLQGGNTPPRSDRAINFVGLHDPRSQRGAQETSPAARGNDAGSSRAELRVPSHNRRHGVPLGQGRIQQFGRESWWPTLLSSAAPFLG